jgi:protocatechuate 3,4-dioxygenase beta subunit
VLVRRTGHWLGHAIVPGVGRLLLVAAAAAALFAVASAGVSATPVACAPTPSSSLDRDYRPGAPRRTSVGKGHVLTGVILSSFDCRPIAGARVELWQQGPNGGYSDGVRSKAWRATIITRANGVYRYEGPVARTGFPHIHMRVTAKAHRALNTTYAISPGERRGRLDLVLEPLL